MVCKRCEGITFEPLLAQDGKNGFYILHITRESYWHSLVQRCALCILISSQLGEVEIEDDVCDTLEAFMVLKRRWPLNRGVVTGARSWPVLVHSRLGFASLSAMDALPIQYRFSDYEHDASQQIRKRKRVDPSVSSESLILNLIGRPGIPTPMEPQSHYTGSQDNMKLARHWIKNCLENHDLCASGSSHRHASFVPTRVVDTKDPKRPYLVAVTDVEYITLSYVWGKGERFRTTRENYEEHQQRIPLENVPETFAHAFQVTRDLGYRYIWIDALCIIQDDGGDLARELAVMGEVYRHATFTVFAERAPDVFAGLFQRRDPYLYRPCAINIKTVAEGVAITTKLTLGTVVSGPNYLKDRGWVLQEEVLSTRSLLFGKQMSWQCTASEASETEPAPLPRKSAISHVRATCEDKLRLWLYAPVEMRRAPRETWGTRWNHYDAWYSVMQEYSTKNLSFAGDQLRALSGLADLFWKAHQSTYLAGLWQEDLPLGLAWYVASNDPRSVSAAGDQKPSWSWASVGIVRIKYRSYAAVSQRTASEGIEILDAFCTTAEEANPLGNVLVGMLRVRARIKKLTLCWTADYVVDRTEFSYGGTGTATMTRGEHPRFPALVVDAGSNHIVGEAALDRPIDRNLQAGVRIADSSDPSTIYDTEHRYAVWCALLHVRKPSENRGHATALILEQDKTDATTYRRLGLLFLDDQHNKNLSFSDYGTETITIV